MNELNQRNNYLMYTVLNGCFFWELWQIMRIEAWKEIHAGELPHWLEAIGEMDALCSLGTFAYNHWATRTRGRTMRTRLSGWRPRRWAIRSSRATAACATTSA